MEAIILAGGKAERLGDAAGGRPKALVEVAGRPLAAYQVVAARATPASTRVIVSCAAEQGPLFVARARGSRPGDRRGRGAGAARTRRWDQVRCAAPAGETATCTR